MLVQKLTYGNKYAAIEHAENNNFHFLQLQKKKNEFYISKQLNSSKLDQILPGIKDQKHLFLIVNDENVLSKKISSSNSKQISNVKNAFPNININDFYFETYYFKETSFVSIARKETIDTIIENYKKKGISIVDFSLGNLAIKNLNSIINNEILKTTNAEIAFDEDLVCDIKKQNVSNLVYSINDLKVTNKQLLSLSGIIGYYSKKATSQIQDKLLDSFFQKRFFDVGLKIGLGFLLLILLTNFLFFSSYRDKVGNLTGELQLSETYKSQLSSLQKEVAQKKRLFKSVNSASNSKLSKYIDELGGSVPKTILLTQINYQPINGVVKSDKKMVFTKNQIVVKGNSKVDENFSDWISNLEKKNWIKKIAIVAYGQGKKNTKIAEFEYIITINE